MANIKKSATHKRSNVSKTLCRLVWTFPRVCCFFVGLLIRSFSMGDRVMIAYMADVSVALCIVSDSVKVRMRDVSPMLKVNANTSHSNQVFEE